MLGLERREFITLLGGAAAAWPLAARAQQPGKLPTIGLWGPTTPSVDSQRVATFVQRLRELGWIEGRTVAIEYRWAEGRNERAAEIAAEFVRLKVDVIVTQGTPSVIAAKQATSVIPIVFAAVGDPVGSGLVASLSRPGSNVTGLSTQQTDTASKRIELFREMVPGLRRLAIMGNVGNPAVEQPTKFESGRTRRPRKRSASTFRVSARSRRRGDRMSNCDLVAARSLIDLAASRLALAPPRTRGYGLDSTKSICAAATVRSARCADRCDGRPTTSSIRKTRASSYPFLADAGSCPGNCSGMEEATGAPSSFAVWYPRRLRASGRDGG